MTGQHYTPASQRFLAQARRELSAGDLAQASEKGWGATSQILKAIAEQRGWEHNSHRHLHQIASRLRALPSNTSLTLEYQRNGQGDLLDLEDVVFYQPVVHSFIIDLLAIAE